MDVPERDFAQLRHSAREHVISKDETLFKCVSCGQISKSWPNFEPERLS